MGGRTRRTIGIAAVAGLALIGGVGVASMSASGQEPPEATDPVYEPFGTLTITLGDRDGTLSLDYDPSQTANDPSLMDVAQEIVTVQPCAQIGFGPLAGGDLLALTPIVGGATTADDTVQLPDDAIGVNSGTNCGNPAGLIGPNELLEIELGSFLEPDPSNPTVFVRSAEVVIDKQFNNDGDLTVGFDGGAQGSPIDVATGGETILLEPDDVFTSFTLGSTSNKDSRGLSVGGPTVLELVTLSEEFEVAVDCGEQLTDVGAVGDIATQVVFFRGENGSAQTGSKFEGDCVDVGVVVEIQSADDPGVTDDRVFWNNSVTGVDGSPQDVAGLVTIDWAGVPADGSPADVEAALEREIDYDADDPAAGYSELLWCESFAQSTDPATGQVTFTVVQPDIGVGTPGANADGTAPWCLVDDERQLVDGEIFQTQMLFGSRDPWIR
jgi:hypothetical protein